MVSVTPTSPPRLGGVAAVCMRRSRGCVMWGCHCARCTQHGPHEAHCVSSIPTTDRNCLEAADRTARPAPSLQNGSFRSCRCSLPFVVDSKGAGMEMKALVKLRRGTNASTVLIGCHHQGIASAWSNLHSWNVSGSERLESMAHCMTDATSDECNQARVACR